MNLFDYLWQLLSPKVEFTNRKGACLRLWKTFSEEQQRNICRTIKDKLTKGQFVDYNPYFAILKNSESIQLTMSFSDYYAKYGTTEECDGWKRQFIPEKQTTIYIKQ